MKNRLLVILFTFLLAIGITGCAKYYKVKDPTGGSVYYTDSIDEAGRQGAIKFKDTKTGTVVTLQNSEVLEVSKEEFKENTQKSD